jgi:hypothetical protein
MIIFSSLANLGVMVCAWCGKMNVREKKNKKKRQKQQIFCEWMQ